MTIVATEDTRNSQWANSSNSYGRKMLEKMGWKGDGAGLGKNQQGTSTHLRAVRRAESLGIGAETDAFGDKGWQDTNRGFHGVLASLQEQYGNNSENEDEETKKKRKKEEKKRRKKEEKRKLKNGDGSSSGSGNGSKVRLAQNKVQAGHARKMREAKDIHNKSADDMAAIFGVKADFYKQAQSLAVGNTSAAIVEDASSKEKGFPDEVESVNSAKEVTDSSDAAEDETDRKKIKKEKEKKKSKDSKEIKDKSKKSKKDKEKKKRKRESELDEEPSKKKKDKSKK